MRTVLKKYYRTCLLILLPLFLISNTKYDSRKRSSNIDELELFNCDLYNKSKFNTGIETTYDGTKFSYLKLHMEDDNIAPDHSVEFTISHVRSLGEIGPGKYRITKDKDGFIKPIDGVFGFVDSKDSGALPLFAHFGAITIAKLDKEAVKGYVNMYFKNTIGDSIHLRGDFVALIR